MSNNNKKFTIDISNDFLEANAIIYFLYALTITYIYSKDFWYNI